MAGITPATISLLLIHLKKGNFRGFSAKAVVVDATADAS